MLWVSSDGLCCWGVGSHVLTNCNNVQNRTFCFLEGTNWLGLGTMCAMDHLWKRLINVPEHRITCKVLDWDLTHNNSLTHHGKLSIFVVIYSGTNYYVIHKEQWPVNVWCKPKLRTYTFTKENYTPEPLCLPEPNENPTPSLWLYRRVDLTECLKRRQCVYCGILVKTKCI